LILAAHQPNFFPWLPFFQKMQQADIFVLLKEVQFEKNGYTNRFNIDKKWYTMSTNHGMEPIKDKRYVNPYEDWTRIKKSLPQHETLMKLFDTCISGSLCSSNIGIILGLTKLLDIGNKLIIVDEETPLTSTDRLVDLCLKYGADTYLSGNGAKKYMEIDKFLDNGINVIFQKEEEMIQRPILEVLSHNSSIRRSLIQLNGRTD
jgi:hypothetical protein